MRQNATRNHDIMLVGLIGAWSFHTTSFREREPNKAALFSFTAVRGGGWWKITEGAKNVKIYYLDENGEHTLDASKAVHGEADPKELKGNRFEVSHNGIELIYKERVCGQPNRSASIKAKRGNDAEKGTSKRTASAKSASKKG